MSSIKDRPLHLVRLSKRFSAKRYNSWMEKGSVRIEHIAQSLGSLEPTPSPLRFNAVITESRESKKHLDKITLRARWGMARLGDWDHRQTKTMTATKTRTKTRKNKGFNGMNNSLASTF